MFLIVPVKLVITQTVMTNAKNVTFHVLNVVEKEVIAVQPVQMIETLTMLNNIVCARMKGISLITKLNIVFLVIMLAKNAKQ